MRKIREEVEVEVVITEEKKGATKENSVHQIGNVLNGSKKEKKK